MKNNYHFEHADIKTIVDRDSSRSAACFATAATTLIIGFETYDFSPLLTSAYIHVILIVHVKKKKWGCSLSSFHNHIVSFLDAGKLLKS